MKKKKVLTPFEIYKFLEQNNCKRCMLPSCLAFAVAVIAGEKRLQDCPHLAEDVQQELSTRLQKRSIAEPSQSDFMEKLLKKVKALDFAAIAGERGCEFSTQEGNLSILSLGKPFVVGRNGVVTSQCHIIPWVEAPLLSYLCYPDHSQVSGQWISFREIKGGIEWRGLFRSRCENPLRVLADKHPDLFTDIVELFLGREVEGFDADIALELHPFPHIPILICYQAPDGDLESELNIFFDACCGVNLHVKSLYTLCAGLVKMFEKIALHHS